MFFPLVPLASLVLSGYTGCEISHAVTLLQIACAAMNSYRFQNTLLENPQSFYQ